MAIWLVWNNISCPPFFCCHTQDGVIMIREPILDWQAILYQNWITQYIFWMSFMLRSYCWLRSAQVGMAIRHLLFLMNSFCTIILQQYGPLRIIKGQMWSVSTLQLHIYFNFCAQHVWQKHCLHNMTVLRHVIIFLFERDMWANASHNKPIYIQV